MSPEAVRTAMWCDPNGAVDIIRPLARNKPTLIVAPAECHNHRTCSEPITRAGPDIPPENVNRLKVLTDPGTHPPYPTGLRCKLFACSVHHCRRSQSCTDSTAALVSTDQCLNRCLSCQQGLLTTLLHSDCVN